jgi:death on curing protein
VTVHLTLLEVLAIHDRMLADFGGARGVRDAGALESALFRPVTGYYDDVIAQAAALLESLLINHPFVDGNKRTAFAAADIFLRLDGYRVVASTDDAHEAVIGALAPQVSGFEHLDRWLREHVEPLAS